MLNNPGEYERCTSSAKFSAFFDKFIPASLLDVSAAYWQRGLVDESGMIRTQVGTQNITKSGVVLGKPCAIPPRER
jgi:hypothetical protein